MLFKAKLNLFETGSKNLTFQYLFQATANSFPFKRVLLKLLTKQHACTE